MENIDKKNKFYKDFRKDVLQGFIIGTLIFGFYFFVAFTSKWSLVFKLSFGAITFIILFYYFFYLSIFSRGRLMQRIVREIFISGDNVEIVSYDWVFNDHKTYNFSRKDIGTIKSGYKFLNYQGVGIKVGKLNTELFIIPELFENIDDLKNRLGLAV